MASAKQQVMIGVDLGGTSILAIVADKAGTVLGECKTKTHADVGAEGVTERIATSIASAIKGSGIKKKSIAGIGVGVPGPVDPRTGVVVRCANLGNTWDGFPLMERLGAQVEIPVTVDNDVNVGALGEYYYGAGQGTHAMLAIFVGTGIGGGIILNGELYPGSRNSAGEVGHMVILAGGPRCGCGEEGHAEALASRTAMEREIRAAIAAGRPSIVPELLARSKYSIMSAGIIGDAYDAGDQVAIEAVQRAQYYLGVLVSACVNLLDPEVVVLGGGVLERMGDSYLEPVSRGAQQHYINKVEVMRVRIVRASLGDYSGALGAAALARQRLSC